AEGDDPLMRVWCGFEAGVVSVHRGHDPGAEADEETEDGHEDGCAVGRHRATPAAGRDEGRCCCTEAWQWPGRWPRWRIGDMAAGRHGGGCLRTAGPTPGPATSACDPPRRRTR